MSGRIVSIYRNISCSTQLHAISFLSQMDLHGCDSTVISTLLNIYIGLFRMLVLNEKMDDKILNALLLATNRAFAYAKGFFYCEVSFFFFLFNFTNYI